jgi:DNA-binding transcriptional MerR regulator
MVDTRTYSIAELTKLSGFDRRTIVFYLQQGLLPRPGRRGPNTRYPDECLARLRLVRGLKDLQDQGRCGTITLADMRELIAALEPYAIRGLLERNLPPEEIEALRRQLPVRTTTTLAPDVAAPVASTPAPAPGAPPPVPPLRPTVGDGRSYGLADAGIRRRAAAETPPQPAPVREAVPPPALADHEASAAPRVPAGDAAASGADTSPEILNNLGELLRELEVRPALTGRRLPPGASEQWTEIPITSRVYLSVRGLSENDAPLADAAARALKKLLRAR